MPRRRRVWHPQMTDAKRRARVVTRDGVVGVLVYVAPDGGKSVIKIAGRRVRISPQDLTLLDLEGDERDDKDRLAHCGPCGGVYGDHLPECPRAGGTIGARY